MNRLPKAMPPPIPPRARPRFDLVEATVLFRRLLGCILTSLAAVALFELRGRDLAGELTVGIVAVAVGFLAAVTAIRLARQLGLSHPRRLGFAAFFPCPNLLLLAFFGAHMLPAWRSGGHTPLLLLLTRRGMEARVAGPGPRPDPSLLGAIATLAFVIASVGGMSALVDWAGGRRSAPTADTRLESRGPKPSAPDTTLYAPFAARGQATFEQANASIGEPSSAGVALGNTPKAEMAAVRLSEALAREVHSALDAYPELRPSMTDARHGVYVHARPERAAVLVHLTHFEALGEKPQQRVLRFVWRLVTKELAPLRLVGARRVALGMRGSSGFRAVMWGDRTQKMPPLSSFGDSADALPLVAFFADARLPEPVPTPSPGSVAAQLLEQRSRGSLRTTAVWSAHVTGSDRGWNEEVGRRFEAIQRYLTEADVEELLEAVEAGAPPANEMVTSFSLLSGLARAQDARITADQERRLALALRTECLNEPKGEGRSPCPYQVRKLWAQLDRPFLEGTFQSRLGEPKQDQGLWSLLIETRDQADPSRWAATIETKVRADLQNGRVPPGDATHYWLEADPARAEQVILDELLPRTLPPPSRRWFAHALLAVAFQRDRVEVAGQRLSDIVALGGPAAADARLARELLGLDPQVRIEALARRWRETRSAKALADLYYAYIEKLPMGTPFGPWLARLGEEGRAASARSSFHVTPRDPGAGLYLELDGEDRLRAISFD